MATEVMTKPLSSRSQTAANDLQATVVEMIELALQGKQAHWNVVGPHFRSVHLELDEIVETARWAADAVAERMAAIGVAPDGRSATVSEARALEPLDAGTIPTEQAIEHVGGLLEEVSRRLHERIARMGDEDPISEGILIATGERIEKHAWMLRAQRS
jgi:starvation-inducible DNA-binding protein